ncbi:MAG: hypothetical protein V1743_07855 [Nanoarchaeota archaeon]
MDQLKDEHILDQLFDPKLISIMRLFFDSPEGQFYLREIAKTTKIPLASAFRIVKKLKKTEIINEIRLKKFKLYQLAQNENTYFLEQLIATKRTAIDDFVKRCRQIQGISVILLHGKESADKASLLIVGQNIDIEGVKRAVLDIKERYNFNIIHLTLEPGQFEQMTAMGLYPGKKVVLYKKE